MLRHHCDVIVNFFFFVLHCARLIVTLTIVLVRLHLGNKNKKNVFLFCIALGLH